MYDSIWRAVGSELSGDRAKAYVERLWARARRGDFAAIGATADEVAAIMREIGLADVEVIRYPADGVASLGGWIMPEAWDVDDATLEVAEPEVAGRKVDDPTLARHADCPQCLMMYSAPTPPEGVTATVEVVPNAGDPGSYRGRDVAGKMILTDGAGAEVAVEAFSRGAVGIVSDYLKVLGSPQDPRDGSLDRVTQWHNYTIPPWRMDQTGFGFSLSPEAGRRLRRMLEERPSLRLRAAVRTRLRAGTIPLVTGFLPGATDEEIALTGHLCEPGANDNASGVALGLEVVRTVMELARRGEVPKLVRGLRPVYTFEVRGYQAFLAGWKRLHKLVAAINLDMVGADLSAARSTAAVVLNFPSLPAYTDALALDLVERLAREDRLFRFRTISGDLVDNLFGEPAVGAPTFVLGAWPDARYHNSLDTPAGISPGALARMGRVAGTYCAFLAAAGFREGEWLARLVEGHAREEIARAARELAVGGAGAGDVAARLGYLAEKNASRLGSLRRLVRAPGFEPTREEIDRHEDLRAPGSRLFMNEELTAIIERRSGRLGDFARREVEAVVEGAAPPAETPETTEPAKADHELRASRLVPFRTFRGALCFESLDGPARRELRQRTGLGVGWGAPYWLQLAAFMSNGRRTALEIHRALRGEGQGVELARLADALEFLADHDFVTLRPVLGKGDFVAAAREAGIEAGAVVMAHTSLSMFGYVEGGARTVIDALVEAVGPGGTLAMPAFSFSFAGRPAFEPRSTPARVGRVSDAFWRMPGALRSAHPTHSVAALGPRAGEITREHSPDRPVLSGEGAFGRLYDLDALVLMLAPLKANTCMHAGEERAGVPLRDIVASVVDPSGAAREVDVRHAPWHVEAFARHYDVLFERGLVRKAPLGEETVHLMRVRDAVDVAEENLRADPMLAAAPGCECSTCRLVRAGRSGVRGSGDADAGSSGCR